MFSVVPLFFVFSATSTATNEQPLRATVELLNQTYCYGDEEIFRVGLKLRLHFENQTNQKLILDKEIGTVYYRIGVAQNKEELAAGIFESHPTVDWFFTDKNPGPKSPDSKSPDASFAMLAPGGSFDLERTAWVFAQYEREKKIGGSIRSGKHVLQMELSPWTRPGAAEEYKKKWEEFGRLVTEYLKTEPLDFEVPANPKISKCKH